MELIQKTTSIPNICGIEIDASAELLPTSVGSLQPFSNTLVVSNEAVPVYFGKGSVSFSQQGKSTRSGMLYEQKLKIRFPNGDLFPAERIDQYQKASFIYIKLSNGTKLFLGRNDYYQNAPIDFSIKTTSQIAEITYSTTSIFPVGLTNGSLEFAFPLELPINLYYL